jgi:hypothetical protein
MTLNTIKEFKLTNKMPEFRLSKEGAEEAKQNKQIEKLQTIEYCIDR